MHLGRNKVAAQATSKSPLEIAGCVTLRVVRQDDAGKLKEKSSRLLVLIDMSSVKTDVTIGHDFISECGGIDLYYDANVLATVRP